MAPIINPSLEGRALFDAIENLTGAQLGQYADERRAAAEAIEDNPDSVDEEQT
jgi:hypothetical protein